jgi:dihydropyrimidinase
MDLVIRGGTVVGPAGAFNGDVAIVNGTVAALGAPGVIGRGAKEIQAEGMYVVPGGVDPHVHTGLKSGGTRTLDNFFESTRAAAYGGTTTIVDFAIPDYASNESPRSAFDQRLKDIAGHATCDVALHTCVTRCDEESMDDLRRLLTSGLPTLKMFTIYRGEFMIEPSEIHQCLKEVNTADGIALVHCESPHLVEPLIREFAANSLTSVEYHARSRPPAAELDMVRTIIELLRITGAMGYVVHVSTPEAAVAILRARSEGVRVWAETCPQYVFLEDSRYSGPNGERFVCSPPLRDEARRSGLWKLLLSGHIDVWGSDHCAYSASQKAADNNDFRRIPNGLPGVETRCPLLFSRGVSDGLLSLADFVLLTATNPARFAGIYPKKGVIAPGADADIAIYDPRVRATLASAQLHMSTDYTPYEGMEISGWPSTVLLRGQLIIDQGKFVGEPGLGRFIPADAPNPPFSQLAEQLKGLEYPDKPPIAN